jgi:D-alanyl-D-alanine carboxypeptidase
MRATLMAALAGALSLCACGSGTSPEVAPPPPPGVEASVSTVNTDPNDLAAWPPPVRRPLPLIPAPSADAPAGVGVPPPAITASAAAVIDGASGTLLYAKDAEAPLAPASLTKIATAVIALREGDLDDVVEVDIDSRTMRGSTVMGLIPGDRFTLRDLLFGMMLPSGNDAALAIGRHLYRSDAVFVARMNQLASELGLVDTHFANPHGLGARGHFTSARDLALLSRYAMTVPGFSDLVGTASWTAHGSRSVDLYNINTFLFSYPGADGIKTGYTRRAGPTLAASAVQEGHRVFVVLLNAPAREAEAHALMDWAFASFQWPGPTGVTP